MNRETIGPLMTQPNPEKQRHSRCKGWSDSYSGEFDCEYGTLLTCEECRYSGLGGRKDPDAECNRARQ